MMSDPINPGVENFLRQQKDQQNLLRSTVIGGVSGYAGAAAVGHILRSNHPREDVSQDDVQMDEDPSSREEVPAPVETTGKLLIRRVGWIGATLITVFMIYGVWAYDPGSAWNTWGQIFVIASLHAFFSRRPVLRTVYTYFGVAFSFVFIVTGISSLLSGLFRQD